MANGEFSLGELGKAIVGVDPTAGEAAYLDALNTGSLIKARQASTESALELARQRRDENIAKRKLGELFDEDPQLAAMLAAGVNPEQVSGYRGDLQTQRFREQLADPTTTFPQRQATGQAIQGQPFEASDFLGPGGELFTDIFQQPTVESFQPTATGAAQIDADTALAEQRRAKAVAEGQGPVPLSEIIAPSGSGQTIIPANVDPTAAFGAKGVIAQGLNALMDAVNLGTPFPKTAEAQNLLGELSARTQIAMRADVPGGRPPVIVQELLGRYAQEPAKLFEGDEISRNNLRTTRDSLRRSLTTARKVLDAPITRTPTKQQDLVENILNLENTIADYTAILDQLDKRFGPQTGGPLGRVATSITGEPLGDAVSEPQYPDGSTAVNPQTGERLIMRNGEWVPFNE